MFLILSYLQLEEMHKQKKLVWKKLELKLQKMERFLPKMMIKLQYKIFMQLGMFVMED